MIKEIIENFSKQLEHEPVIENAGNFHKKDKFIVCGMGGSNLAAGIIKSWKPRSDIIIHRDYGLPEMDELELKNRLIIASSYSGNTEETISSFNEALSRGLSVFVIATQPQRQTGLGAGQAGGELLELAKQNGTPYIQMPRIDDNPRFAIGYSIKATLKAMGEESLDKDITDGAGDFNAESYEQAGKELAEKLKNKMPLIYSSGNNAGLARYWKISFNETAKVPAFYNFLPELNHNEMVGFTPHLSAAGVEDPRKAQPQKGAGFVFIFLKDPADPPKIQKRSAATKKLFEEWGYTVLDLALEGETPWQKTFSNIITAMWTSYFLAEHSGVDPEDISMIEDFKKSLVS